MQMPWWLATLLFWLAFSVFNLIYAWDALRIPGMRRATILAIVAGPLTWLTILFVMLASRIRRSERHFL